MSNSSIYSPYYTYQYDSLSCYAPMKPVHVAFAWIVGISGFICFVTRIIPSIRWMHAWSGRVYIIAMLWATACSLLIFNHGLPVATIISFVFVMAGLAIGWIAILIHRSLFQKQALQRLQETLAAGELSKDASVEKALEQAQADVSAKKTFLQRFLSLKTLHGCLMFLSWINVAGRIFVTDPTEPFYCYSYPVYKPIDTPKFNGSSTAGTCPALPPQSPNYDETPWAKTGLLGWGLIMSLVPLGFGLIVAAIAALIDTKKSKKTATEPSSVLVAEEEVSA